MECPQCKGEIGGAAYCGCGWKRTRSAKGAEPFQFIQCAHMACGVSANVKVKTPTGWANFCPHHYDVYFLDRAEETCRKLGLDTVEKKREYVRDSIRKLAAKWKPDYNRQREPGDDDEEMAA